MITRALIILFLVTGIGGGAWFGYRRLYAPPALVQRVDIPPPPGVEQKREDPLDPPLNTALRLVRSGQLSEALAVLQPLVSRAHTSRRFDELKAIVGELNVAEYLSPKSGTGKQVYTVVRGDSISRISAKFKTPIELIVRVNNLTGIDLQIGQELVLPQGEFSAVLSPSRKTLIVFRGIDFFKEYGLVSVVMPRSGVTAGKALQVSEKISWSGGERVAFGSPQYHAAARWISLGVPGATLFTVQPAAEQDVPPPATGFGLEAADMNELFLLLPRQSVIQVSE